MNDSATPFQAPPAEELEELLPSYSEIRFIAQGGMAAVYKGLQTSLERAVAIKVLPREFGADDAFRIRFGAEAKTMAKLNHPNLVAIYDFGEVQDLLYLVMEFVEGQTLHDFCHQQKLPQIEALGFAASIAEGLAHAHDNKILHRDIKPANILLDAKKNPKLGDFGLAHGAERDTGDDLTFGTPGYTAPEVTADPHSADPRSDIYSVGVLLYELLTAQVPTQEYLVPSQLVASDPRLDTIIKKCLHPNPGHRYSSAKLLAQELAKVRKSLQSPSQPPHRSESPAPAKGPGFDFALLRNLIIIAGLSLAIWGHGLLSKIRKPERAPNRPLPRAKWKNTNEKKRSSLKHGEKKGKAKLSSPPKKEEPATKVPPNLANVEEAPPSEPEVTLPAAEQLAALKNALASGNRDRFPAAAVARDDSHYFFVDTPLTWYEAISFAEDHGGHLAILPTEEDLTWATSLIGPAEQVWLGAGSHDEEDWAWFDGRVEVQFKKPNTTLGTAASMTDTGEVKATPPSTRLPFLIEWNHDESYSLDRELQLSALESGDNDVWPVGTLSFEGNHYLIIARSLTFEDASAYATRYYGHLAVPSTEAEATFLRDAVTASGLGALWLGAAQKDDVWGWVTSEPWSFARWAPGFPFKGKTATALVVRTEGWANKAPKNPAPGFIIEWSDQAKQPSPKELAENASALDELNELRAKAKELLSREMGEKLKNNYAAQGMAVRQWLRSMSQGDANRIAKLYDEYAGDLESTGGRFSDPNDFELRSKIISDQAAKILQRYYGIQKQMDEDLKASANNLRTHYLQKVEALKAEAQSKGLASQVSFLKKEIASVGTDGMSFISYLNFEPEMGMPRRLEIISARFGSRGKFADVTDLVKERLAEGGRFRVLSRFFQVDPDPGWNKSIQITYNYDGETFTPWFNRNQLIHEGILVKKAKSLQASEN